MHSLNTTHSINRAAKGRSRAISRQPRGKPSLRAANLSPL